MTIMDRRRFLATSAAGLVTSCSSSPTGTHESSGSGGSPSIQTSSLPDGTVGVDYPGGLTASGGKKPYQWTVAGGSIPPGLRLVPTTGAIIGPPTAGGDWDLTVRVTDAKGESDSKSFVIRISEPRLVYGLYDNFDGQGCWQERQGRHWAQSGELSSLLWFTYDEVEVVPWDTGIDGVDRGNVLRMEYTYPPGESGYESESVFLKRPEGILFQQYQSLSANLMVSPASTCEDFSLSYDLHTAIPEQPPGVSWYAMFGMKKSGDDAYIYNNLRNKNTGWSDWRRLDTIQAGTWYNLRIDIAALNPTELQFDFFVDGERVRDPIVPPDSEILMDPARAPVPWREIQVETIQPMGTCIGYVDNVRAVYTDHDLPPS